MYLLQHYRNVVLSAEQTWGHLFHVPGIMHVQEGEVLWVDWDFSSTQIEDVEKNTL